MLSAISNEIILSRTKNVKTPLTKLLEITDARLFMGFPKRNVPEGCVSLRFPVDLWLLDELEFGDEHVQSIFA